MLLLYGLRRGEVLGLSWRDVDQDQGVCRIRQQLIRAGGRLQPGPVKTSAGRREPPLLGLADEVLSDQAGMRVLGNGSPEWAGQELVFTTRSGNPVERRNLAGPSSSYVMLVDHQAQPAARARAAMTVDPPI